MTTDAEWATCESMIERLASKEDQLVLPAELSPMLARIRLFLREELPEGEPESMLLIHAAWVVAAVGGACPEVRLIPLASGVEMIYHSLTSQQDSIRPGNPADLFGILARDLVLARALDLFVSDGDSRVMTAVSEGAASLCEAMMADRFGSSASGAGDPIARFYSSCVRIGCAVADRAAGYEDGMVARIERGVRFVLDGLKEIPPSSPNRESNGSPLFDELLSRWLRHCAPRTDGMDAGASGATERIGCG